MKLGDAIHIRLPIEKQELYKAEAALQKLPLTIYIRNRLEATDDMLTEISRLRSAMEYTNELVADSHAKQDSSAIIEMLFLLRQMVQPHTITQAQNELKRLGYNVWSGERK
jgi:hypothetical protein